MKSLFEQMGVTYRHEEDYLVPNITPPNEGNRPIGIWGQRHLKYLKQHHKVLYNNLLTSGKLNDYLADIDIQAEEVFNRLVKQMTECKGVSEQLKVENLCYFPSTEAIPQEEPLHIDPKLHQCLHYAIY